MTRYVCIHGHFYQPPRESPWTNQIEVQPSAAPFPNWNYRINKECYRSNSSAPILNAKGLPALYMNNYAYISYNFGPTLLRWMQEHNPDTLECLKEADAKSIQSFGFGTALAQVYHHAIMPLCNARDKRTEISWGLADFEYRYKRPAQGIWLAETAADIPTLEALADQGIQFTILAPEQCKRVRPLGWKEWQTVKHVDTTQPYRISLPSGKSICVFFYHGDLAQDVAFRGALNNGEDFGKRIISVAMKSGEGRLTHYATDGESYGHHHRYGEVALAYCLKTLVDQEGIEITNYASYLSEHPPVMEAEIHAPSSWSCAHGVGRWSRNCGCVIDPRNAGKQEWRSDLRAALNWLRDRLKLVYEIQVGALVNEPWLLRDGWMKAELEGNLDGWIQQNAKDTLRGEDVETIRSLMEIQRHALQMFTSCGWFFDDPAGIEPVQILRYAARAMELQKQFDGTDFEEEFVQRLLNMQSLNPKYPSGLEIWAGLVKS
ncbi:MAG: DUF3536 domain-containing protein [Myxococcota bacterium]|nr:DUF3536 domain-containing protein [Myxococcota bacterium]